MLAWNQRCQRHCWDVYCVNASLLPCFVRTSSCFVASSSGLKRILDGMFRLFLCVTYVMVALSIDVRERRRCCDVCSVDVIRPLAHILEVFLRNKFRFIYAAWKHVTEERTALTWTLTFQGILSISAWWARYFTLNVLRVLILLLLAAEGIGFFRRMFESWLLPKKFQWHRTRSNTLLLCYTVSLTQHNLCELNA